MTIAAIDLTPYVFLFGVVIGFLLSELGATLAHRRRRRELDREFGELFGRLEDDTEE